MIKFFRRIRQKLLTENRLSPYLFYAIGEIVLVVIGILIALSINNWNENRKEAIQEKIVLETLLENLKLAKKQSQQFIVDEKLMQDRLIWILDLEAAENKPDTKTIPDSIFKMAAWDIKSDQPTFNAYFNLKSTDQLGLIKNKKITEKFTFLESSLSHLNNLLEDRLSVHQTRIDDILEYNINFLQLVKVSIPRLNVEKEVNNDYQAVLGNPKVRNLLGMKLSFTNQAIIHRIRLDQVIEELIILLQKELNQ